VQSLLVVDDEQMIRSNLQAYFEDEGYQVFAAETGEAGLEILNKEMIHAAIVDMRLSGMDGNAFVLAAHKIKPELKIIIHTGSSEYVLPQELLDIGMTTDQVIFKPLADMKTLINMVGKLIAHP